MRLIQRESSARSSESPAFAGLVVLRVLLMARLCRSGQGEEGGVYSGARLLERAGGELLPGAAAAFDHGAEVVLLARAVGTKGNEASAGLQHCRGVANVLDIDGVLKWRVHDDGVEIGRASCRERV